MSSNLKKYILLLLFIPFLSSCQKWNNFSTYYNLFWNIERIDKEIEDETDYIREDNNPQPTFYIPDDDNQLRGTNYYSHLEKRALNEKEKQANKIKLDSILIKGSKLMSRNATSDYVDGSIFYVGKSYFYLSDYYQSQKKFQELVKNFPRSTYVPEGHLFWAMDLLRQAKPDSAQIQLSRAIDAAFYHKNKNVLTEAFRLNADIALNKGDLESALKPYYKALALSSDNEESARWQYEIALIHFRNGEYEDCIKEFDKVKKYSPDELTEFETNLQKAVAMRVLERYNEAVNIINSLKENEDYAKWKGLVEMEEVNLLSAKDKTELLTEEKLKYFDTTYKDKPYSMFGLYERGLRLYRQGKYQEAWSAFSKTQNANTQFQKRARRYTSLLGFYLEQQRRVNSFKGLRERSQPSDSIEAKIAESYYNIARTFSALAKKDSMKYYYKLAEEIAPEGSFYAAQILYANAINGLEEGNYKYSDSLFEILVDKYSLTEFAKDARMRLGYTEFAKIDTVADLFASGMSLMRIGEKERSLSQFRKIIQFNSDSEFAPQAYYAIGLLFEEQFQIMDSAFVFYQTLLDLFPLSPQATAVKPIIEAVLNARMKQNKEIDPVKLEQLMKSGKIGLVPKKNQVFTGNDPEDRLIPLSLSDDPKFDHSKELIEKDDSSRNKNSASPAGLLQNQAITVPPMPDTKVSLPQNDLPKNKKKTKIKPTTELPNGAGKNTNLQDNKSDSLKTTDPIKNSTPQVKKDTVKKDTVKNDKDSLKTKKK